MRLEVSGAEAARTNEPASWLARHFRGRGNALRHQPSGRAQTVGRMDLAKAEAAEVEAVEPLAATERIRQTEVAKIRLEPIVCAYLRKLSHSYCTTLVAG